MRREEDTAITRTHTYGSMQGLQLMEEHHSWEDDKRLGFKNEVYSLVAASDMEDWFHEDVSLHFFPD